jgi:hypothetical protein
MIYELVVSSRLYGIGPINAEKLGMPKLQSKQHNKAPPFIVLYLVTLCFTTHVSHCKSHNMAATPATDMKTKGKSREVT